MFAFDLDGTLARSKQPMKTGIAGIFAALTYVCPVAIVSGGRLSLLHSQIVDVVDDVMNRENLHLMPTTGTRYYRWDGNGWECVFQKNIPEEEAKKAVAIALRNRWRRQQVPSPLKEEILPKNSHKSHFLHS